MLEFLGFNCFLKGYYLIRLIFVVFLGEKLIKAKIPKYLIFVLNQKYKHYISVAKQKRHGISIVFLNIKSKKIISFPFFFSHKQKSQKLL